MTALHLNRYTSKYYTTSIYITLLRVMQIRDQTNRLLNPPLIAAHPICLSEVYSACSQNVVEHILYTSHSDIGSAAIREGGIQNLTFLHLRSLHFGLILFRQAKKYLGE